MEPSNNETPTFGTPTDMSRFIEGHDRVGILVTGEVRAALFDSLTELLAREKRRIVRISDSDHLAVLRQSFGDLPTPIPTPTARTSAEWRDVLIAGLREEEQSAQERIAAAKAIDAPIDSFERDVSSWLAAGLRDLFDDPITAASFLIEGKGIFARLAAGVTEVRFAESDFLRPDGIRFLEAGRPAQSMLTKLTLASTSQYRVAAARLLNRVLEQINAPQPEAPLVPRIAQALSERGEELVLLVEENGPLDWLRDVAPPIRVIVAVAEASVLPDRFALLRYALPMPEIFREANEVGSAEPAPTAIEPEAQARESAELFIQRGLLRREDIPEGVVELRQRLSHVWRNWFTQQLEDFDAEGFLTHEEEVATLARNIAAVTAIWEKGAVALRLPASAEDFVEAEEAIAEICRLDREWRIYFCSPVEEGMAFDAKVAAGGAPLDMLTEGVRWWLRQENRDWKKYRIVRIEETEEFEAKREEEDHELPE